MIKPIALFAVLSMLAAAGAAADHDRRSWIDPEDGWPDLSRFVDRAYGFVPVVVPITEPAVGYGAAGALVFINRPAHGSTAGFRRPDITAIGGLATEDGTWGALAADVRYWRNDRLQTVAGFGYAVVYLDFYGLGAGRLTGRPLAYSLRPLGGVLRAKYRLGARSRWWAGLGYSFASTEVSFDLPADASPGHLRGAEGFRTGGVAPTLSFDSRDNFFTPTRGVFAEAYCGLYGTLWGGESDFQKPVAVAISYLPLHRRLVLGVRGDAAATFGDAPFYMRPFVSLRGVAAMRYQGEEIAQVEAEIRWQFWKRISAVGFGGAGSAWNGWDRFQAQETVTTGGAGVRYEVAHKYGLHMGADVAFGPDEPILYIQFGSAWLRP